MTVEETRGMLKLLKAAYPQFYKSMRQSEAQDILDLWIEMFAEDDVQLVKMALKLIIDSDREFPPTIGTIKGKMSEIENSIVKEKTNEDYWLEFKDAVVNGGYYGCVEAFEKLSPVVKEYCGSPSTIRDCARMEESVFNTVTHGQFLKQIAVIIEREKVGNKIPPQLKQTILLNKGESQLMIDDLTFNAGRNNILDQLEN